MQLNDLASDAIHQLFGRLLRRAIGVALLAVFSVIALYYANGAGTLALAQNFGALNAYLIMAAIYTVLALVVFTVLSTNRSKPVVADKPEGILASPKNMQIAMLVEAVMLGYTMARKTRLP